MGRFINADVLASTGQGLLGNNMFAYCNNCPVRYKDSSGTARISTIVHYDDPELIMEEDGNKVYKIKMYIDKTYYGNIDNPPPPVTITKTVEYQFSINSNGIIAFDNLQENANLVADPQISYTLGSAMEKTAKSQVSGALSGRTLPGIERELRIHCSLSMLDIFSSNTDVTHIGSVDPTSVGYDYNAEWFENPIQSIPKIIKFLSSMD